MTARADQERQAAGSPRWRQRQLATQIRIR
jgi:hypothetical protein